MGIAGLELCADMPRMRWLPLTPALSPCAGRGSCLRAVVENPSALSVGLPLPVRGERAGVRGNRYASLNSTSTGA